MVEGEVFIIYQSIMAFKNKKKKIEILLQIGRVGEG